MSENPKETSAFARVGLICGRLRNEPRDKVLTVVNLGDQNEARLTYGNLRDLLAQAYAAGDRLQRIASWHSRETGPGGTVGDYCIECGLIWPCETRRMADGTHEDLREAEESTQ